MPAASPGPREVDIAYNRFVDQIAHQPRLPSGATAPPNERYGIHLGTSKPGVNDTGSNLSLRIHHNVLVGHRPHAIYLKRHCYVGFNYIVSLDRRSYLPQISFRHGGGPYRLGGIIEGNYADGKGISVNDTGARILGNNLPTGVIKLHCGSGTWLPGAKSFTSLYQAASDCLLVGNIATYRLGYASSKWLFLESEGGAVRNVQIHMAGNGTAEDVLFEPRLPRPTSLKTPGPLAATVDPTTVLIDPSSSGDHQFPQAIGAELLALVGIDAL